MATILEVATVTDSCDNGAGSDWTHTVDFGEPFGARIASNMGVDTAVVAENLSVQFTESCIALIELLPGQRRY